MFNVRLSANIKYIEKSLGLALVKLPDNPAGYLLVKIAVEPLKIGDAITVLGYPYDQGLTVSTGIIASTAGNGGRILITSILPLGFSGSPIFNSRGEAIGIILARISHTGF